MPTNIATTIADARRAVAEARQRGLSVGLVPTMGALHAGHLSLIRAARQENGFVVVSIFVNPTQFGPSEDLARYPRPFAEDVDKCRAESVDLIFHPDAAEMYPDGHVTFVEVHSLQEVLCGASRPGHFRGVATVVLQLFNIVQPDAAYFGQKDAQQARIIARMIRDLHVPVRLRVMPIVRESDGLALSSRNQYLDAEQRKNAVALSRALQEARRRVEQGERTAAVLVKLLTERIAATPGAVLDYAAVVDEATLQPLTRRAGKVLMALAVRYGATRLIDNTVLEIRSDS